MEKIRSGAPTGRVFKAIDRGFERDREIAQVTGLELPVVRRILALAESEQLLKVEEQGGQKRLLCSLLRLQTNKGRPLAFAECRRSSVHLCGIALTAYVDDHKLATMRNYEQR